MDIPTIITTIMRDLDVRNNGPVFVMLLAFCYIFAFILAWVSLMQMKDAAEMPNKDYKAPIYTFIAACMMAALPDTVGSLTATVYREPASPLTYVIENGPFGQSFTAVLTMVSLIGYFFVVRGIWAVREAGEPQRYHNASVGKAICILAAGMAAINIDFTIKVVAFNIGWDVSEYLQ